jgi:hypothetical protein
VRRKVEVPLHRLAHARSGDKGNQLNIALICYDPACYDTISEQVTAERVAAHFAARQPGSVVRYELPKLKLASAKLPASISETPHWAVIETSSATTSSASKCKRTSWLSN